MHAALTRSRAILETLRPQFLIPEPSEVLEHQTAASLTHTGRLGIFGACAVVVAQGLRFPDLQGGKVCAATQVPRSCSAGGQRSARLYRLDSGESSPLAKGQRPGLRCQVPCSWGEAKQQASPILVPPCEHSRAAEHVGSSLCSAHPDVSGDPLIQQIPAGQLLQSTPPPPSPGLGTHLIGACPKQSTLVGLHRGTGCSGSRQSR